MLIIIYYFISLYHSRVLRGSPLLFELSVLHVCVCVLYVWVLVVEEMVNLVFNLTILPI